jgi:hypothetical protein
VIWPPHVKHGAWTEHGQMRAIIVELAGSDDSLVREILPGEARALAPGEGGAAPAEGGLAERLTPPDRIDRSTGEPL